MVQTERLGVPDIPAILALLSRVWPQLYGDTGCPAFSEGYLGWLYGGPDAERHMLLGVRDDAGELVAVKVALYRAVRFGGRQCDAFIATHLAVDPRLPFGQRMAIAGELSKLHSLERDPTSLGIAYFEADKPIVKNMRKLAQKMGYQVAELGFEQFIVNPRKLLSFDIAGTEVDIAPLTPADCDVLAARLGRQDGVGLIWTPSAEALAYNLLDAQNSFTVVARGVDGALLGAVGCYVLDWQKADQISRMMVCERLIADSPSVANLLLRAANTRAQELGLRGVVIENATYLPKAIRTACGMLKTPRQMIVSVRGNSLPNEPLTSFDLDIK